MHYNNTQKERSIKSGVALTMVGVAMVVLLVIAARRSFPTGTDVSHLWRTQSILVNGKDVKICGTAADTEDTVVKLLTMEEENGIATLIIWGTKRKLWEKDLGKLSVDARKMTKSDAEYRTTLLSANLEYVDLEKSGLYRPMWVFEMSDSAKYYIDCNNGWSVSK